ncbi:MAG: SpoIIE family protein phosphatase [Bacteroidota bacterium]
MNDRAQNSLVRAQLVDRRFRVNEAMAQARENERLVDLLKEIDAALERIDGGSYGICDLCHGSIEEDYLRLDPLVRICFTHLSRDQQEAIERDLELASGIQARLLPKNNSSYGPWEVSFSYEPAGSVSGDYLDVIQRESESGGVMFLVGDVSGKGVAASLLMSQLHAIFRTLVTSLPGAEDLLSRANRMLSEATHSTHFATLVFVDADFKSGTIQVCNAGHPRPYLLSKGKITPIERANLPLGLFYSGSYSSSTIVMEPGDLLLLYTDGITECFNADGVEYGDHRLRGALTDGQDLSPKALVETVLSDLRNFRGDAGRSDDLTMMAIRRLPPA